MKLSEIKITSFNDLADSLKPVYMLHDGFFLEKAAVTTVSITFFVKQLMRDPDPQFGDEIARAQIFSAGNTDNPPFWNYKPNYASNKDRTITAGHRSGGLDMDDFKQWVIEYLKTDGLL
jgi:hypothetical protein